MSTATVERIRTELAVAEATAQRAKRDEALAAIPPLRRQGAEMQKEFRKLSVQVRDAQAERLWLHDKLLEAAEQVRFYGKPLDPVDFPSDADVAEHAKQLKLWKEEQQKLLKRSAAAAERESARMRALELEQSLLRLRGQLATLKTIAAGRKPGEIADTGLSRVERFL
jgi:hypothetical protein